MRRARPGRARVGRVSGDDRKQALPCRGRATNNSAAWVSEEPQGAIVPSLGPRLGPAQPSSCGILGPPGRTLTHSRFCVTPVLRQGCSCVELGLVAALRIPWIVGGEPRLWVQVMPGTVGPDAYCLGVSSEPPEVSRGQASLSCSSCRTQGRTGAS